MNVQRSTETDASCEETYCRTLQFRTPPILEPVIYENPSSGRFTVQFDASLHGEVHLQLLNSNQALIKKWRSDGLSLDHRIPVDAGALPSGLYFLRIETEGRRWLKKVVIQR